MNLEALWSHAARGRYNLRLIQDVIMRNPIDFERLSFWKLSGVENYLARRAAMPISPQRRTVGDLAVRPTVRVDRR